MSITNFFKTQRRDIQKDAVRYKCGKSKEEQRKFEMLHLRPDPLPATAITKHLDSGIAGLTVRIIFHSQEALEAFKQYFTVSTRHDTMPTVSNTRLLMLFIKELEKGRIKYDKRTKQLVYT